MQKRVRHITGGLVALLIGLSATASHSTEVARVVVETEPLQQMTYGMDFERMWHFVSGHADTSPDQRFYLKDLDQLARYSVGDCRVDYVRIAINPAVEREEGKIDWSVYDPQLDMMRAIARVRADIQWFASPRPVHNEQPGAPFTCYPLWISVYDNPFKQDPTVPRRFNHFDWEKGADYYLRYLRFMEDEGFTMTYLDSKNEACIHMRPVEQAKMIERMRETLGDKMPLVVAPSSHNRGIGQEWIEEAIEKDSVYWDVTAVHNTHKTRGAIEDFMKTAEPLGRPVWNTELHGFNGPDAEAAANSIHLWQHIRAGFGGINDWCSLGNERKEGSMFRNIDGDLVVMRTFYIFKQLVNTSVGGHYLASNVPDTLTSTAAFIKDDTLTVWILNANDASVETAMEIDGLRAQPVEVHWWGPDNGREGSASALDQNDGTYTVAPDTLYCFTFKVERAAVAAVGH